MATFFRTAWRGDDFSFTTSGAAGGSSWAPGDILSVEPLETDTTSTAFNFILDPAATSATIELEDDDGVFDDFPAFDGNQLAQNDPFGDAADFPGPIESRFRYVVTDTVTGDTFNLYIAFIGPQGDYLVGPFDQEVLIFTDGELVPGREYSVATNGIDVDGTVPFAALVCFASGALISTPEGKKPIEAIQVGDLVDTADNGPQPVRWIGARRVPAKGRFAPVVISEGVLGANAALRVSRQHRVLLSGWRAELLFGEAEVLAPAGSLIDGESIYVEEGGEVTYYHVLFDRHEVIFANGVASESFQPGSDWLGSCEAETRAEVLELFPELATRPESYPAARMSLRGYEARAAQA